MSFKVTTVIMAVSVDPITKDEGVCASFIDNTWMPLIAGDEARFPFIESQAQKLALVTGMEIRLLKFTNMEVVNTFGGTKAGNA